MKVAVAIALPVIRRVPDGGAPAPGPSGNGLIWDAGNYLIWGSGNYLIWGT